MIDQQRNPDGTLKPGAIINPTGNNGQQYGQPWKVRARIIEERYSTLEDLLKFFELIEDASGNITGYKYRPEFRKLPHRDSTIIHGLLLEYIGEDKIKAQQAYWDRHDGKPTQRNELTGKDGGPIVVTSAEAADLVRSKLLSDVAASGEESKT